MEESETHRVKIRERTGRPGVVLGFSHMASSRPFCLSHSSSWPSVGLLAPWDTQAALDRW